MCMLTPWSFAAIVHRASLRRKAKHVLRDRRDNTLWHYESWLSIAALCRLMTHNITAAAAMLANIRLKTNRLVITRLCSL